MHADDERRRGKKNQLLGITRNIYGKKRGLQWHFKEYI